MALTPSSPASLDPRLAPSSNGSGRLWPADLGQPQSSEVTRLRALVQVLTDLLVESGVIDRATLEARVAASLRPPHDDATPLPPPLRPAAELTEVQPLFGRSDSAAITVPLPLAARASQPATTAPAAAAVESATPRHDAAAASITGESIAAESVTARQDAAAAESAMPRQDAAAIHAPAHSPVNQPAIRPDAAAIDSAAARNIADIAAAPLATRQDAAAISLMSEYGAGAARAGATPTRSMYDESEPQPRIDLDGGLYAELAARATTPARPAPRATTQPAPRATPRPAEPRSRTAARPTSRRVDPALPTPRERRATPLPTAAAPAAAAPRPSFWRTLFGGKKVHLRRVEPEALTADTARVPKLPTDLPTLYGESQHATDVSFPPQAALRNSLMLARAAAARARTVKPDATPADARPNGHAHGPGARCPRCWRTAALTASGICATCISD